VHESSLALEKSQECATQGDKKFFYLKSFPGSGDLNFAFFVYLDFNQNLIILQKFFLKIFLSIAMSKECFTKFSTNFDILSSKTM
jgi:hypothetical protein